MSPSRTANFRLLMGVTKSAVSIPTQGTPAHGYIGLQGHAGPAPHTATTAVSKDDPIPGVGPKVRPLASPAAHDITNPTNASGKGPEVLGSGTQPIAPSPSVAPKKQAGVAEDIMDLMPGLEGADQARWAARGQSALDKIWPGMDAKAITAKNKKWQKFLDLADLPADLTTESSNKHLKGLTSTVDKLRASGAGGLDDGISMLRKRRWRRNAPIAALGTLAAGLVGHRLVDDLNAPAPF